MALQLKKRGIARVRPLAGGFLAWKELNYPTSTPVLVNIDFVSLQG